MRFGFLGQFPEARQIAGEIGAHGLPLWINALANQAPEAAIAPIRNAGMEVCQIGVFGYNPLSPNRVFRRNRSVWWKRRYRLWVGSAAPMWSSIVATAL